VRLALIASLAACAPAAAPRAPEPRPSLVASPPDAPRDASAPANDEDATQLDAKKWVYAAFFNKMKREVARMWDPAAVWRRIDPTSEHYGRATRVTAVRVTLSPTGELTKIVVTSPSGVADLDDEAVRAFHAAAPFANPPAELVGADGAITFAFSFYFEINGRSHVGN
jgi:TonB family protein